MLENHKMCGITTGGQVFFQLLFPPLLAVLKYMHLSYFGTINLHIGKLQHYLIL